MPPMPTTEGARPETSPSSCASRRVERLQRTSVNAGVGIRMRTGRAISVVLIGTAEAPQVFSRREVTLWDPMVPESNQPFHAALELAPADAKLTIEKAAHAVRRAAERAFSGLQDEVRSRGYVLRTVGLVR